mgnify:FL=1|jgi:hypothetical protein
MNQMKINSKFEFQFIPFILSFIVGVIYIVITNNTKEKIVKTPTPFSNNLYSDFDGECYRVDVVEAQCQGTEQEFNFAI